MKDAAISPWPADKVERRKVADLLPYAKNSRTHSDAQIDGIAASIQEWGWTVPVLIDEAGTIIAGHGRIQAAHRLGIKEVPCMTAAGWSDAQRRAYVIADNKLAENAGWDQANLGAELDALSDLGFNLSLTGFNEAEVAGLVAKTPELPAVTEALKPMQMTHILISFPNHVGPEFLADALSLVVARGGRVDYGGN